MYSVIHFCLQFHTEYEVLPICHSKAPELSQQGYLRWAFAAITERELT